MICQKMGKEYEKYRLSEIICLKQTQNVIRDEMLYTKRFFISCLRFGASCSFLFVDATFVWLAFLSWPSTSSVGQKSLVLLGINAKSQRFSVNLFFDTDSLWYVIWNRFRFCLYFTYMTDSFLKRERKKRREELSIFTSVCKFGSMTINE